jgi:hypothetical protein
LIVETVLIILVVVALFWAAPRLAGKQTTEEKFVSQVLETDKPLGRKNFIIQFNEASAYRYHSVAGTVHYFLPLGRCRLVTVHYDWVPFPGAVPAPRVKREYQIPVARVLTGEAFMLPVTCLEICSLHEALMDAATDDARGKGQ